MADAEGNLSDCVIEWPTSPTKVIPTSDSNSEFAEDIVSVSVINTNSANSTKAIPILDIKGQLAKLSEDDNQNATVPIHFPLAAAWGNLNKQTLKKMDDKLKVIITSASKAIGTLDERAWKNVVSCMMGNPLLERIEDACVRNSEKIVEEKIGVYDVSPNHAIVKEIHSWFVGFINDQDILNDIHIDVNVMAQIVGHIMALFRKRDCEEREIIDMAILRYPETKFPYLKLYRIRLNAWNIYKKFGITQRNGITGYFDYMKFKPRDSVVASLKADIVQKAVLDAEAMLG